MKLIVKPATPWNVTLAKLQSLEVKVNAGDHSAMEARWLFGKELLTKRVDYKGQLGLPGDLMKLAIKECKLSENEIQRRIRFAERYPTKKECLDAIKTFPSWYQMFNKGLVLTKRVKKSTLHPPKRTIRKLANQLQQAYEHHATLTRDDVKDIEHLLTLLQTILDQVDRNDQAKVS